MKSKKLKGSFSIIPIIILILIMLLYVSLSFYIGKENFITFSSLNPNINATLYWILFWLIAFSYIIGLLLSTFFKGKISNIFLNIGFFWIGLFYYFLLVTFILDIIKLFIFNFNLISKSSAFYNMINHYNSLISLIIVCSIIIYGAYVGTKRVVTTYKITIDKKASKLSNLNIAMVSDIHLGTGFGKRSLEKMVFNINLLKPDIIFICGDLIDENTPETLKKEISGVLKNLASKYGTFAVLGNHEYGAGNVEDTIKNLSLGNVTLLKDEFLKIDNGFYLIGRDDFSSEKKSLEVRNDISSILNNCDTNLPLIVLDHQPVRIDDKEKEKIDLQLSGHTHHGQFFPNNLITKIIFDNSYGYLRDKNYQLIVSSGYGTWGPLIRVATKCEIVNIKVNFN